jgi:hypothetical protein
MTRPLLTVVAIPVMAANYATTLTVRTSLVDTAATDIMTAQHLLFLRNATTNTNSATETMIPILVLDTAEVRNRVMDAVTTLVHMKLVEM